MSSQVIGSEDHPGVFASDSFHHHKQFLYRRIADRKAPDGDRIAVDEDVSAQVFPPLLGCLLPVKGIGIVELHRKMIGAVGVE